MYLDINNNKYEIVIERKNNKNTYIRVKDDLKIHVTTNKWTREKEIKKLITDNYDAIIKMINRELKKKENNKKNMIMGREVDIIVFPSDKHPTLYNNKFYIPDISKLDKYLKEYAYIVFKERLDVIYDMFEEDIPYPKIKIRSMKTRWGVCNKKDISVTLNLELIRKDVKYLDYVIVHELSHLVYFNHSADFWALVGKYCKNYKQIRKEMKE